MKSLAFILIVAVVLISACKKDDALPANSFKPDNQATVKTPYGFVKRWSSYYEVTFATFDTVNNKNYNGKASFIGIEISNILPGTYSFYENNSTGNSYNNFSCWHEMNMVNGVMEVNSGTPVGYGTTEGNIKIKEDKGIYSITYSIRLGSSKITGNYVGELTIR